MTERTLDYYLSLPYTVELQRSSTGSWFAQVKELPGCGTQGETREEALAMLDDAMRGWLAVSLEDGDPIPEPRPEEEYSGQFRVRVPRSLHRRLVEAAEDEGVSLNQFISTALGEAVASGGIKIDSTPAARAEGQEGAFWPGLSAEATRVLQAAGLRAEAAGTDERLFTDWLLERLGELGKAYSQGSYASVREGLDYLVLVTQRGEPQRGALKPLSQILALLRTIIDESVRRDLELLDPNTMPQRLTEALRTSELSQFASRGASSASDEIVSVRFRAGERKVVPFPEARRRVNAK